MCGQAMATKNEGAPLTLPAIRPPPSIGRGPIAPRQAIEPGFVVGIALLSLADDAGEFFDRVNVGQRRHPLDEPSIVPLAPAAQPSSIVASLASHCATVRINA